MLRKQMDLLVDAKENVKAILSKGDKFVEAAPSKVRISLADCIPQVPLGSARARGSFPPLAANLAPGVWFSEPEAEVREYVAQEDPPAHGAEADWYSEEDGWLEYLILRDQEKEERSPSGTTTATGCLVESSMACTSTVSRPASSGSPQPTVSSTEEDGWLENLFRQSAWVDGDFVLKLRVSLVNPVLLLDWRPDPNKRHPRCKCNAGPAHFTSST